MKQKFPYEKALPIAEGLISSLSPYCQRIEIAGSVRRKKPEVGDIEIVAIPKFRVDLFGQPDDVNHALNTFSWQYIGKLIKDGNKYKQVELLLGLNLDLFIVTPPAQWGVQLLIRTGPADYSHMFVTARRAGGMLPSDLKVRDGAIWRGDKKIETPEEEDVYRIIGLPWVPPEERK